MIFVGWKFHNFAHIELKFTNEIIFKNMIFINALHNKFWMI
jgi:hypothetical protein